MGYILSEHEILENLIDSYSSEKQEVCLYKKNGKFIAKVRNKADGELEREGDPKDTIYEALLTIK